MKAVGADTHTAGSGEGNGIKVRTVSAVFSATMTTGSAGKGRRGTTAGVRNAMLPD